MSSEYTTILKSYGFSSLTEDLRNTITAYTYEINGVLFDEDSPFSTNESETRSQPEDLNTLVYCTLRLKTDSNIHDAINYLISKWYRWLRQSNPIYENIETTPLDNGTRIRILTISEHTACTIEFKIFQNK